MKNKWRWEQKKSVCSWAHKISFAKSLGLPVKCACADQEGMCQGTCLGPLIKCMGFCIALGVLGEDLTTCSLQH